MQLELALRQRQLFGHAQDRRDPDAAREQQRALAGDGQRKVVSSAR
jgi:hypothetical protein